MPGKTSKEEQVALRKKRILVLVMNAGGQVHYSYLVSRLAEMGMEVKDRTVRNDCRDLIAQGLAEKIKKGVALTLSGREFLKTLDLPESGVKKKHLKQIAILKLLYNCERKTIRVKGLPVKEIAACSGIGSEDTVEDILRSMREVGLVFKDGRRWRLTARFVRPVSVKSHDARSLYEYLDNTAGLLPLSPVLKALKSKLVPLMMMPERGRWQESLVKVISRVIVHGRDVENKENLQKVIDLVETAVSSQEVVRALYKGREVRIRPLGVFYHWEKMNWYIVALISGKKTNYFRVDRLGRVELTGENFRKPAGFDLEKFMAPRWGAGDDVETGAVVRFRNTDWYLTALDKLKGEMSRRRMHHSHCELEEQPEGMVLLRDRLIGLPEFASWIRSYGDAAEVLEPEALRDRMAFSARRMLARYLDGSEADGQ